MKKEGIFQRLFHFYQDGFKSMTVGKTLWIIVLVKLFIMFAILKVFFFPNLLQKNFKSDADRGTYVGSQLIDRGSK